MLYSKNACFNSILMLIHLFQMMGNLNVHMYMILSGIKNLLSNTLLPCYIHISKYQHDFMYANNV